MHSQGLGLTGRVVIQSVRNLSLGSRLFYTVFVQKCLSPKTKFTFEAVFLG